MIDSTKRENVDIQLDKLNPDEKKLNASYSQIWCIENQAAFCF